MNRCAAISACEAGDDISRVVFEQSPEAIIIINAMGSIEVCNPAAIRLLANSCAQLHGHALDTFITPCAVNPAMDAEESPPWWQDVRHSPREATALCGNGVTVPLEAAIAPICVDDKPRFIISMRDISERKRLERILAEQPMRDPQSGLYGARMLPVFLADELDRALRHGHPLALMLVEIDTTDGTLFADAAQVVNDYIRLSDKALCVNNSCLALLLPETTSGEAESMVARLKRIIAACCIQKYLKQGKPAEKGFGVYGGIAAFPRNGETPDQLIAAAGSSLQMDRNNPEGVRFHV